MTYCLQPRDALPRVNPLDPGREDAADIIYNLQESILAFDFLYV